ncbi:MAG TPA: aldehyde dehydrogenase family protein [Terriglobales bacterium]|nr:aldehyde dehydrogenase family protein [Terriglobales bacterium]
MSLATLSPGRTWGFYLGGNWITDRDSEPVLSPFDQSVIAAVPNATPADLERAITAAVSAFELTRKMSSYERQQILRKISAAITARREELAQTMSREAGKPIKAARVEVDRAAFTFDLAAEESTRLTGEWLPLDQQPASRGRYGILRRFAIGPIAAITPFNFPLNLVAHKVAPAIACGCTVVLKPAPQTPFSALLLAELIHRAGWPEGALSILPMSNETAAPLITDDRLKLLSFTGSGAVGWKLKQQAGKKRVVLELGGNAGVIIHSDADLAYAAARCIVGGFSYQGQSCISVQRIFVHRAVFQQFVEVLVAGVNQLSTGDPADERTDVGPLIRLSDAERVESWINEAVASGARVLTGGRRRGSLIEPTVLVNTSRDMRVSCMEVFAPLVLCEPYDDFADAVRRVNDSQFGLQAGVFTRDAQLIDYAYQELQVGGVIAGDVPTWRLDNMPYGGWKDSGLGREGVRYSIEEMTERKLLVMAT